MMIEFEKEIKRLIHKKMDEIRLIIEELSDDEDPGISVLMDKLTFYRGELNSLIGIYQRSSARIDNEIENKIDSIKNN